jgi:hypothetical protein
MYNTPYNQFGYYGQQMQQPMPQMYPQRQQQTQTIQTLEQKPLQATCYFVKSLDEFKVDVLPGVYYLGINESANELYVRKINDLGNPELKTYRLSAERKEKTELQTIADRLSNIEKQISGLKGQKQNATITRNETNNN